MERKRMCHIKRHYTSSHLERLRKTTKILSHRRWCLAKTETGNIHNPCRNGYHLIYLVPPFRYYVCLHKSGSFAHLYPHSSTLESRTYTHFQRFTNKQEQNKICSCSRNGHVMSDTITAYSMVIKILTTTAK
jgi:hypothetical protein